MLSLPDAMEPLVDYYRQAMVREKRVLLRLRIEHAGPDRKG